MRKLCWVFALLAMLVAGSAAQAGAALDFQLSDPGTGAISEVAGGPLVGAGIVVTSVKGINGTPANNNVNTPIVGGLMAFTTGAQGSSTASSVNYGMGGTITITGTASPASLGPTLLDGTFLSATLTNILGQTWLTVAVVLNHVDASLASFYGLPGGPTQLYAGALNFTINVSTGSPANGGAFTATGGSGDLQTSPVPAPAGLVLALAGAPVLGLGYLRRRRKVVA